MISKKHLNSLPIHIHLKDNHPTFRKKFIFQFRFHSQWSKILSFLHFKIKFKKKKKNCKSGLIDFK